MAHPKAQTSVINGHSSIFILNVTLARDSEMGAELLCQKATAVGLTKK